MNIEKLVILVKTDKDEKLIQVAIDKQGMEMLIATLSIYAGNPIKIIDYPFDGIKISDKKPTKPINTEYMTC